jgi:hypothetical protein
LKDQANTTLPNEHNKLPIMYFKEMKSKIKEFKIIVLRKLVKFKKYKEMSG